MFREKTNGKCEIRFVYWRFCFWKKQPRKSRRDTRVWIFFSILSKYISIILSRYTPYVLVYMKDTLTTLWLFEFGRVYLPSALSSTLQFRERKRVDRGILWISREKIYSTRILHESETFFHAILKLVALLFEMHCRRADDKKKTKADTGNVRC